MKRKIISLLVGLALLLPAAGTASAQQQNLPRLIGAISLDNTHVRVVFSRAMANNAANPLSYTIVQKNADTNDTQLVIIGAQFTAGSLRRMVDLTTASQSDVSYELMVAGVFDTNGNAMATKEIIAGVVIDPSRAIFQGTPPRERDLVDLDGDSLSDNTEMRGWLVYVTLGDQQQVSYHVTSDPGSADTDGDGIPDDEEAAFGSNPRSPDTDKDMLTDYQELNEIYSDPANQDTDGDGLGDGLELKHFETSPIVADTDGDQFTDAQELLELDRNPLIADLPRLQILVGDVRLGIRVTSSYTDESGQVRSNTDSLQTTLSESQNRSFGTSDTVSNETTISNGAKIGAEVSASVKDGFGVKGSVEASFSQSFVNGFTSTTDQQSAEEASREYQESVSLAFERSQNRAVTRTLDGAEIVATVNIQNLGDISFNVTSIEISVLKLDRQAGNRFIPIAALRLEGATDPTQQPAFNLGPFDPERGPFIFKNTSVFPSLVEELMREPQGLVYRVVNFDLQDEFGRNFAFSAQDVNDRTAGITIDFGQGNVESYHVATHNLYDDNGQMQPITMQRALEIIGITPSTDPSGDTLDANPEDPAILNTYGTQRDDNGVEVLTRIRGTQTDFSAENPEKRFWVILSTNRDVPATQDFSTIELHARDNFVLVFTRDLDQDGLLEQEEMFYGSSDESADSDGDTISDLDEVRTGWIVSVKGQDSIKVFSSPISVDTDSDGLTDAEEQQFGTDPTKRDTDFDGLSDRTELYGPIEVVLFDGDEDELNNPLLIVPSYEGPPAIVNAFDATSDTSATGDDVQEVPFGEAAADGQVVIAAGPDNQITTMPNTGPEGTPVVGGDDYQRVRHDQEYITDPLNPDTDSDGISDGREVEDGINPNRVDATSILDSDRDGLSDYEETSGWTVTANLMTFEMPTITLVTSNPLRADSDRDGIPDIYERAIGTNPRLRDTDGDGLFDYEEFDINDPIQIYDRFVLADAQERCAAALDCSYEAPDKAVGTNPLETSTDMDGRTDFEEHTKPWNVTLYNTEPVSVFSDPLKADEDGDGLNDQAEFIYKTNPTEHDTDADGRNDKAEIDAALDPLRQDYWLTVTLTTIEVNGDCDGDGAWLLYDRRGLELSGSFLVVLDSPYGETQMPLHSVPCVPELDLCNFLPDNCCYSAQNITYPRRLCAGGQWTFNKEKEFIFSEGDAFILRTTQLVDNDTFFCPIKESTPIGSLEKRVEFNLDLESQSPMSLPIGESNNCKITVTYTFQRD